MDEHVEMKEEDIMDDVKKAKVKKRKKISEDDEQEGTVPKKPKTTESVKTLDDAKKTKAKKRKKGKEEGAASKKQEDDDAQKPKRKKQYRKKCIHNRQKSICKECKGVGVCSHNLLKSLCAECGGSQLCIHKRKKYDCKKCGGSAFCCHNRPKSKCKICGGSSVCSHNRQRVFCKECGGSALCIPHKIRKDRCKKCGGSAFCSHGHRKDRCRECGGSAFCSHGNRKEICKECGGSAICSHGIAKYTCKDCGGSGFCSHKKRKEYCAKCGGSKLCVNCKFTCVQKRGDTCAPCTMVAKKKSRFKEQRVADFLQDPENKLLAFTRWNKVLSDSKVCRNLRPDFVWDLTTKEKNEDEYMQPETLQAAKEYIEKEESQDKSEFCRAVILEVDEYQHNYVSYELGCELSRQWDLVQTYGGLPVHMIRYNPDSFKLCSATKRKNYSQKARLSTLAKALKDAFDNIDFAENLFTLQYLFYDNAEGTDILQTYKFKTLEDYVLWMEQKISEDQTKKAAKACAAGVQGAREKSADVGCEVMDQDGETRQNDDDEGHLGKAEDGAEYGAGSV